MESTANYPRLPSPIDRGVARLSQDDGGMRIELSPVCASWTRYIILWVILGIITGAALLGFGGHAYWTGSQVIGALTGAFGILILLLSFMVGMLGLAAATAVSSLRTSITCDGTALHVQAASKHVLIPSDEIQDIRVAIIKPKAWRIELSQPPLHCMRFAPAAALEIQTARGRLRLLRQWEIEDIEWVQQALAEHLPTAAQGMPDAADAPILDVNRYMGESWKLLATLLAVIALPCILWGAWSTGCGLRSKTWPVVTGQVVHAHHEFRNDTHTSEMQYTYRVAGRQYTNDRIYYAGTPSDEQVIKLIETHPDGSSISVRYSPDNPARSVLLPGADIWDGLLGGVGICLLICSAYFCTRRPTSAQVELADKYLVSVQIPRKAKHSENEVIRRLFR